MSYKPQGYTSAAPYLIVDDVRTLIRFLTEAFAAEGLRFYERENGRVKHAEVRIDDTVLMLAEPVEGWPALTGNVHIYVPDVDTTYEKAVAAGGFSLQTPARKDDPDKRGGVSFCGINWWIATQQE
jgi:PhnB protein